MRIATFVLALLLVPSLALAVGGGGGGGGGGTSTCDEDEWECGDWSECSLDAEQTRDCALSFDCEFDDEPSPSESQSCSPDCTQDTWECGDWNACDVYGNQSRSCSLTQDCAGVVSEKPTTAQRCASLQCESGELVDRVACRLHLEPAGLERELEIRYFPEVCRPFEGDAQEECVEYYANYEPCWEIESVDGRLECAKKILWLTDTIPNKKAACVGDGECLEELEEHVYHLILFRFYDLEQRAEGYIQERPLKYPPLSSRRLKGGGISS